MGILSLTLLTACGTNTSKSSSASNTTTSTSKHTYVSESQVADVFSNPDKFKGKYIKLTGKIFANPEVDGKTVAIQAFNDIENSDNNFIVATDKSNANLKQGDYILVDGEIRGKFDGKNAFGGDVSAPVIEADKVTQLSYIDAVVPTQKSIAPTNAVAEQNGIKLQITKVEYAEKETRVYLTETNASSTKFSFSIYDMKITQNGQQIEQDQSSSSQYDGKYPELSDDLLPNASSSGILVFPKMDANSSFQLNAEGYSDDYNLTFSPFTITVNQN